MHKHTHKKKRLLLNKITLIALKYNRILGLLAAASFLFEKGNSMLELFFNFIFRINGKWIF